MRLDFVSLFGLLIAIAGFTFAGLAPQWTAFGVLVMTTLVAIFFRSLFHPALFLGVALTFILLLGGLNLSNYRGSVSDETFAYILRCITILSGSASLVSLFTLSLKRRQPRKPLLPHWAIIASLLPAIAGVMWIVSTVGIPLFNPNARFAADPKALFLAEMGCATASLMALRYYMAGRFSAFDWLILAGVAVFLLIPGYRNWLIVAILVNIVGLVRMEALKVRVIPAAISLALALGFLGAMSEFRRAVSSELLTADQSMLQYKVQYLPSTLAQLHFGLRESIALTGRLIEEGIDFSGKTVFFADILTMLPGTRTSGGRILADAFGAVLKGGLTPGLVGVWTVEFGVTLCFAGFALCGAFAGTLWRLSGRGGRPEIAILYGYFSVNFLLLFHRGILKPSMVWVPLYFLIIVLLLRAMRPQRYSAMQPEMPPQTVAASAAGSKMLVTCGTLLPVALGWSRSVPGETR
ncbi:hypothetical protein [Novosphingobium aquimarinum]|uniref:hypothetical protein n=1 Tax=Novosphingobium aquimarinum TaxID=2682494 RepID=UPI0012EB945C|nr:hypothetical protein [Novosphingobium aquimarinum]